MMQDKAIRRFGSWCVGVTFGIWGLTAACAGGDTPPRTNDFERQLAAAYGAGSVTAGAAGTASMPAGQAGTGGSGAQATGGTSGSGSGTGAMAGAAGSGVASGGSGGDDPPPAGGECDGLEVLTTSCGMPSCHGGTPTPGALSAFANADEVESYVGEETQAASCPGGGILLNPDNPASSLVIQKMRGTASCGGLMPLGGPALSDDDISCVEEWIESL